jgi:endonuclease/exonuclease/phosphatase family metal-dependent hydrolase
MATLWRLLAAVAVFSLVSCGSAEQDGSSALDAVGSQSFTVLTYNVQSRPVLDRQRARRNLPKIGSLLNAFDLVGTQECFASCNLLLNAADHPSKAYFGRRKHWWSFANSGLATLGRLPLVEIQTEFYDDRAEIADRVASKGILLTRYQLDGFTLDVYNTHMQAGHSAPAARARRSEAEQLVRFVARNSPPEHAVIVQGDFNMGPHRPGRPWQDYAPLHYSSAADMEARTSTLSDVMQALELRDAADALFGPRLDHIERILYRAPMNGDLVPVSWQDRSEDFLDDSRKTLSDSTPIAVQFSLTRL